MTTDEEDPGATIIQFPEHKIFRNSSDLNNPTLEAARIRGLENFCQHVLMDMADAMEQELENYGVDAYSDDWQRDFTFACEILKAGLYRVHGLPHEFQDFIDKYVKELPPGETEGKVVGSAETDGLTEATN